MFTALWPIMVTYGATNRAPQEGGQATQHGKPVLHMQVMSSTLWLC
jgi:hypothetical protein